MESNNPGPFIKKAFSPTVLVIANQEVDDMCKKNGLEVSITSVLEACGTTVPASRGTKQDILICRLLCLAFPSCFACYSIINDEFIFLMISSIALAQQRS